MHYIERSPAANFNWLEELDELGAVRLHRMPGERN